MSAQGVMIGLGCGVVLGGLAYKYMQDDILRYNAASNMQYAKDRAYLRELQAAGIAGEAIRVIQRKSRVDAYDLIIGKKTH